ncbi:MAG: RHS repeat-associated core domain-containing protein [Gemmatimonadetes bacterium]|nr:RHS repeat-associated core domain-containing protein [Gemmatimonadota bacterium]
MTPFENTLNRLVRVAQGATLIARYAYDVLGRRIAKRVYSAATGGTVGFTRFVYHGGQVAFETDSGRQHDRHPVCLGSGDGQPGGVPDQRGRDRPLLCGDRQAGQRHQIIKRDGTWVRTYGYTPYGSVAANAGSGVTLRYRWTGREWDAETGWYFHRARYYDPGQRRFVQEDPAGVAGGENLYAYVGGRPLVARDPTGLAPDWEHFRSIAPPECCHVGYEAWTSDFNNDGLDDLDALLFYVWTQKCNRVGGCAIEFEGPRATELKSAYERAKHVLELAANSGGELAESAREFLEYLAAYESMGLRVVDDPVTAWDAGTTRNGISYIDVGFHERHPDAFYLPLTIVHELGHQNTQRSGFFGLSETLALGSENVIREFLGWPARADHSHHPILPRRMTP